MRKLDTDKGRTGVGEGFSGSFDIYVVGSRRRKEITYNNILKQLRAAGEHHCTRRDLPPAGTAAQELDHMMGRTANSGPEVTIINGAPPVRRPALTAGWREFHGAKVRVTSGTPRWWCVCLRYGSDWPKLHYLVQLRGVSQAVVEGRVG